MKLLKNPVASRCISVTTPIRRRLTLANLAAVLVLVFAMSGGALAASHYPDHLNQADQPACSSASRAGAGRPDAQGTQALPARQAPPGPPGRQA